MLAADCSCSGGDAASVWRLPGAAPMEDLDLEFSEPAESARCNDRKPRGLCATFCTASCERSETTCDPHGQGTETIVTPPHSSVAGRHMTFSEACKALHQQSDTRQGMKFAKCQG